MKPALFRSLSLAALVATASSGAPPKGDNDEYRPHTPTLVFHLSGAGSESDSAAIRASVEKLSSVRKVAFSPGSVQVRFDSHVISYHQVAQAIVDAGTPLNRKFDPTLKITIPGYGQPGNAAKVDAILAGKRLNQRIRVEPLDKDKGIFALHFLPLASDPKATAPLGFNGGHLHHPISDPPPRGLGLKCDYEQIGAQKRE